MAAQPGSEVASTSGGESPQVESWPERAKLIGHTGWVRDVAFADAGGDAIIASAGDDGSVRLWDATTGELRAALSGHEGRARGVAFGTIEGHTTVAAAMDDGTVPLWDATSGEPRAVLTGHEGHVRGVAFGTVDGRTVVASAGDDATVRLWDAGSGEPHRVLTGHEGHVRGVAFGTVDGRTVVASAGDDGTVRLWDAVSGEPVRLLTGHEGRVRRVAFGEVDGRPVVASAGPDGTRLWDAAAGGKGAILTGEAGGSLRVAFGEVDARQTIASSGEDDVRLWDAGTGEQYAKLEDQEGRVRGVAFGEVDGRPIVVTAGEDGAVRLWNAGSTRLRDQVKWVSDAPALPRDDLLGRMRLAEALATRLERMRDDDRDTSFLIHIHGPWGSGKSTVLGFLQEQLGRGWLVVTFDAWRQSRVGPPWWALLTSVRDAVAGGMSRRQRWWFRIEEAWARLRRAGAPYLLGLLLLLALAASAFLLVRPASLSAKDVGEVAQALTAVIAAIATLWAGSRVVSRFLLWDSATGARVYEQSQQNPMEGLADHFAWIVTRARARVVFFIDDLDRCDCDYVVDLLDAVQTLIRDAPRRQAPKAPADRAPYFVVAADGAWIRQSYEATYASFQDAVRERGRSLGYLFLDKIFQLTVDVPAISPSRQQTYLENLLGRRPSASGESEIAKEREGAEQRIRASGSEAEVLAVLRATSSRARAHVAPAAVTKLSQSEVEQHTEHALQKFAELLEPNPRAMKRFLNTYSMARAAAVLEDHLVHRDPFALWTILRVRWPDLADHLCSHPGDIDALVGETEPSVAASDQVTPLFASPDVRRVVSFQAGLLTSEVIRELSGTPSATPATALPPAAASPPPTAWRP